MEEQEGIPSQPNQGCHSHPQFSGTWSPLWHLPAVGQRGSILGQCWPLPQLLHQYHLQLGLPFILQGTSEATSLSTVP